MGKTGKILDMFQNYVLTHAGKDGRAFIEDDREIVIYPVGVIELLDDTQRRPIKNLSDFFSIKSTAQNWQQCYKHMYDAYKPIETDSPLLGFNSSLN